MFSWFAHFYDPAFLVSRDEHVLYIYNRFCYYGHHESVIMCNKLIVYCLKTILQWHHCEHSSLRNGYKLDFYTSMP